MKETFRVSKDDPCNDDHRSGDGAKVFLCDNRAITTYLPKTSHYVVSLLFGYSQDGERVRMNKLDLATKFS